MIVLGITDSITSGAAIVEDGRVVAAIHEERLNRQKMAMGFPRQSIDWVLKVSSVPIQEVDHVVVATNSLFWRPEPEKLEDYFRVKRDAARDMFLASGSFFAKLTGGSPLSRKLYYDLKRLLTRSRRKKIKETLQQTWHYTKDVSFLDHHLAHCASAYFTSGLSEATAISLDGAGDDCSSHVYHVRDGHFQLKNKLDSYDSIGNYYAYVTHLCGFKAHRHEGKITGLAAYGNHAYVDLFRRYLAYQEGKIRNIGKCFDWSAINRLENELGEAFSKADLSASVQYILEEMASQYVDYWVNQTGASNVVLSGGVFANVKLNQRVHELESVHTLFVHPGMGDEGLATGAALYRCFQLCRRANTRFEAQPIGDVYWGPEFSDQDIQTAIRQMQCPHEYHDHIEPVIAALLAQGKVVARFAGRMEYGPRALGNRSILYQTTDTSVNDWLNKRLQRTEFMPFAPVTLKEYADTCYANLRGAEHTAKFMTITFDCTESMKTRCPAVVHVDGTARPQIIDKDNNASYYAIVDEYRKLTGIPSLINTSFNMHEEPIVCTPDDALRSYTSGDLDYLAIGHFLVGERQTDTKPSAT